MTGDSVLTFDAILHEVRTGCPNLSLRAFADAVEWMSDEQKCRLSADLCSIVSHFAWMVGLVNSKQYDHEPIGTRRKANRKANALRTRTRKMLGYAYPDKGSFTV